VEVKDRHEQRGFGISRDGEGHQQKGPGEDSSGEFRREPQVLRRIAPPRGFFTSGAALDGRERARPPGAERSKLVNGMDTGGRTGAPRPGHFTSREIILKCDGEDTKKPVASQGILLGQRALGRYSPLEGGRETADVSPSASKIPLEWQRFVFGKAGAVLLARAQGPIP